MGEIICDNCGHVSNKPEVAYIDPKAKLPDNPYQKGTPRYYAVNHYKKLLTGWVKLAE